MDRRWLRLGLVAVGVLAAIAFGAVAVSAHGHARPDLTIASGSVSTADGQLHGSFTVPNKGSAKARKSAVSLSVTAGTSKVELQRLRVRPVRPHHARKVTVNVAVPADLAAGSWPITACADANQRLQERSEKNNCRAVGTLVVDGGSATPPPSSVPTDPVPFTADTPQQLQSPETGYWVDVPSAYDATHATPMALLVWLHGCSGLASGDIYTVSPGGPQDWISVTVGGREGACWSPGIDSSKVLAAIASVKTHFNIDPHRVILSGYSSGGDLAYRTAFYNSSSFAGLLVVNTSPFRDTGSTQAQSLAAATTKFHIVHLAHLQDAQYPIAGVRTETDAVTAAGFPLTRVEVDGGHFDDAGDTENGHSVPGTNADIHTYLLSHIDDGWRSP